MASPRSVDMKSPRTKPVPSLVLESDSVMGLERELSPRGSSKINGGSIRGNSAKDMRMKKVRERKEERNWPPQWALPPWPVWSDKQLNEEVWDVGRKPKSKETAKKDKVQSESEISDSPTKLQVPDGDAKKKKPRAKKKPGSKVKKTGSETESEGIKSMKSSSSDDDKEDAVAYIPFEDPLGPGVLPPSLSKLVVKWVRGAEVPHATLLNDEEANKGADVTEPADIAVSAAHALKESPLLRWIVSSIRALHVLGKNSALPLESTEDFIPPEEAPWRPWHHIYSLCQSASGEPPEPQFNPSGKYIVRLYYLGAWRRITVDDRIPEDAEGRPLIPLLIPPPPPEPAMADEFGPRDPLLDYSKVDTSKSNDTTNERAKSKTNETTKETTEPTTDKDKEKENSKGDSSKETTDTTEEEDLDDKKAVRLWPAILIKALLRVASLSWREGMSGEGVGLEAAGEGVQFKDLGERGGGEGGLGASIDEWGELRGFSAVQCLTGWLPHRLELIGMDSSLPFALCHRLLTDMNADEGVETVTENGRAIAPLSRYKSPLELKKLQEVADKLMIPIKYSYTGNQYRKPRELENPLKDEGLWDPIPSVHPAAERLRPAAVFCVLGADPRERCSLSLRNGPQLQVPSCVWATLQSDDTGEASEVDPPPRGEEEEEEEETYGEDAVDQEQVEHELVAPRWEHPALITAARLVILNEDERPVTTLWKRHRWKAWAIERGIISPDREPTEEQVRIYTPLKGIFEVPPPPKPPGPLHVPFALPRKPLGYPVPIEEKETDESSITKNNEKEKKEKKGKKKDEGKKGKKGKEKGKRKGSRDSKKEKKASKAKKDSKTKGKGKKASKQESKANLVVEQDRSTLEPWIRFAPLLPHVRALEVYYRPSAFQYVFSLNSLSPEAVWEAELPLDMAAVNDHIMEESTEASTVGSKDSKKKREKNRKKKHEGIIEKEGKSTTKEKKKGGGGGDEKDEQNYGQAEPLYLLMDSLYCKKMILHLSALSDGVLDNVGLQLELADPQKPKSPGLAPITNPGVDPYFYIRDGESPVGYVDPLARPEITRVPYEEAWDAKALPAAHVLGERYHWGDKSLGPIVFALRTCGTRTLLLSIPEGMAAYRLWIRVPRNFFFLAASPTPFAMGCRTQAHTAMARDSTAYSIRGANFAAIYNQLMEEGNDSPKLPKKPSPETKAYRLRALRGEDETSHGKNLKTFFDCLLPQEMPTVFQEKTERIWLKIILRLEEALISLAIEKKITGEELAQAIQQWRRAFQEPFFGQCSLIAYEEKARITRQYDLNTECYTAPLEAQERERRAKVAGRTRELLAMAGPEAFEGPLQHECDFGFPEEEGDEGEEGEDFKTETTAKTTDSKSESFESESGRKKSKKSGKKESMRGSKKDSRKGSKKGSRKESKKGKNKKGKKGKKGTVVTTKDMSLSLPEEAVFPLEKDIAITILRRMFLPKPDLLALYPFREDHFHRVYHTEYTGTVRVVCKEWCPLVRCVINPHQERPVRLSIFCDAKGFPLPRIYVVDNNSGDRINALSRYGAVEPFCLQRTDLGYTILAVTYAPPGHKEKEVKWIFQLAAPCEEDLVHYCRQKRDFTSHMGLSPSPPHSPVASQSRPTSPMSLPPAGPQSTPFSPSTSITSANRNQRSTPESKQGSRIASPKKSLTTASLSPSAGSAQTPGSLSGIPSATTRSNSHPGTGTVTSSFVVTPIVEEDEGEWGGGKKGPAKCTGVKVPPPLRVGTLKGPFTDNSDHIVCKALLTMPLVGGTQPVLVSLRIWLSNPEVDFYYVAEDADSGFIYKDGVATGAKTIPAWFLEIPSETENFGESTGRPSERMGESGNTSRGPRTLRISLTVVLADAGWPLTKDEYDLVQKAKRKEWRVAKLDAAVLERMAEAEEAESIPHSSQQQQQQTQTEADFENVTVNIPSTRTSAHSEESSRRKRSSLKDDDTVAETELDQSMDVTLAAGAGAAAARALGVKPGLGPGGEPAPGCPWWQVTVVLDAEGVKRASLLYDYDAPVRLKHLKEQWEEEEPGRHYHAEGIRRDFLRRLRLPTEEERRPFSAEMDGEFRLGTPELQPWEIHPSHPHIQHRTYTPTMPPEIPSPRGGSRPAPPPPTPIAHGLSEIEEEDGGQEDFLLHPITKTRPEYITELVDAALDEGVVDEDYQPTEVSRAFLRATHRDLENEVMREDEETHPLREQVKQMREDQRLALEDAAATLVGREIRSEKAMRYAEKNGSRVKRGAEDKKDEEIESDPRTSKRPKKKGEDKEEEEVVSKEKKRQSKANKKKEK